MKNTLQNIDCLKGLEEIQDNSVDACITDPPYGIGYQSAWRTDKSEWKPKILNDEQPFIDWIEPMYRKLKEGGRLICFYRWDVQDDFLDEIKRVGFDVKSQIVWDKVSHGMGDLGGEFAPQHELMIYATKGRYEFKGKRPKTVYKFLRIQGSDLIHPNEKPVPLIAAIIRDITEKNELVIDPFGGSFSTALAAHQEGRSYISYELHEEYFSIGVKRFNELRKINNLFNAA
jgi:DNA modification methylase